MEYYGKHISVCEIKNTEDIDYWIFLTKQLLKKFFS
jgi:hypothetical protein